MKKAASGDLSQFDVPLGVVWGTTTDRLDDSEQNDRAKDSNDEAADRETFYLHTGQHAHDESADERADDTNNNVSERAHLSIRSHDH